MAVNNEPEERGIEAAPSGRRIVAGLDIEGMRTDRPRLGNAVEVWGFYDY
jgi:hypothetical protein